jgi:hypothetical protein
MNKEKLGGFTIIELIGVFAIIGLIFSITISGIQKSKQKKADLSIKAELAEIQVDVSEYDIAPGVIDFNAAFSAKSVATKLLDMASSLGVSPGEYEYAVTSNEYAIVFPLKKSDTFYCVDSTGASSEVTGLVNTTGPRSCSNATRYVAVSGWEGDTGRTGGGGGGGGANTPPVITLAPPTTVGYGVNADFFDYNGQSVYGVLPASFPEISYTATDAEDGDLTSEVVIVFPDTYRVHLIPKDSPALAFLKKIFNPSYVEAKGGPSCLAVTTRMYQVTDSGGLTATAYRDFTAVCS